MSELKQIISNGEGVNVEFVAQIDNQREVARTIVAFANTHGGKLLVGIKRNGKFVGSNPAEDLALVQEIVELNCKPSILIESKVHQEGRHLILEVEIPKSEVKHKAKDENQEYKFYHRIANHTLLVNRIVVQLWKLQDQSILKPSEFSQEFKDLIELIEENQPITVSKLYRLSSSEKSRVNELVASLIHWDIADCIVIDTIPAYTLHE